MEAVSFTQGHLCICTKQNTPKTAICKICTRRKNENHKIIRNTQKKQKYFQEKEKNIVCSLHASIAIMHNVTRSYEYEKGGFSEMKKKVISLILAATMVATMATGCGSSSGETTTTDNAASTTTDAAAPLPRLPIRQQQQQKQLAATTQTRKSAYAFTSSPITS